MPVQLQITRLNTGQWLVCLHSIAHIAADEGYVSARRAAGLGGLGPRHSAGTAKPHRQAP